MRARHAGELVSFGGCLCFGDERDPQFACRRCHTRFGQVLPVFILPEGWTTSGKRRLCHGASAGLAGVGRRESRAWLRGWGGLFSAAEPAVRTVLRHLGESICYPRARDEQNTRNKDASGQKTSRVTQAL